MKAKIAVTINILCGIGKMLITGLFIFGISWFMLSYGIDPNTVTVDSMVNDPGDVLVFSILAGITFSPLGLFGKLPFSESLIGHLQSIEEEEKEYKSIRNHKVYLLESDSYSE